MSQWGNTFSGRGRVTKILIGINVLVFLAQMASNDAVTSLLKLERQTALFEPWTLLTSGFAHFSVVHILVNMYSLWIFGEALEEFFGSKKFLRLYLLSILGGSLAFVFFDAGSVAAGASGGIFGLMGAYFIMIRAMGFRSNQILGLIAINVIISFVLPNTALTAHLGGLATGAAISWNYTRRR
jgi:membrane associated rhomboid family serine protease